MSKVLKCCGSPIRPDRFVCDTEDGKKIFKSGYCNNPRCNCFNLIVETINLFGRVKQEYIRGKKAIRELERYQLALMGLEVHQETHPLKNLDVYGETTVDTDGNYIHVSKYIQTDRKRATEYTGAGRIFEPAGEHTVLVGV